MIFISDADVSFVSNTYVKFVSVIQEGTMQIKIQILDDENNPIPGVTVNGQLELSVPAPPPENIPIAGVTDANGEV